MFTLKYISLKSISSNLNLNYLICLKNNWKIPEYIGNKIFQFYIKNNKVLMKNDVKFFYGKINSISLIELNEKLCFFQKSFLKFNKRSIKEINDKNCANSSIDYSIILKNILKDTRNIENIYLNCNNYTDINDIIDLLENSCQTMKYIHLTSFQRSDHFGGFLEKCDSLEKVCLEDSNFPKIHSNISKWISNSINTITELIIRNIEFNIDDLMTSLSICSSLESLNIYGIPASNLSEIFFNYNNPNSLLKKIEIQC